MIARTNILALRRGPAVRFSNKKHKPTTTIKLISSDWRGNLIQGGRIF